jgi:Mg2+-importing ATPase
MASTTEHVQQESGGRARLDLAAAAALPVDEVLRQLGSSQAGLTTEEAQRRLTADGPNVVRQQHASAWRALWSQLRNPLLLLLLVAAAISGFTGNPTDAIIITIIVVMSVTLGFLNEYRAAVTAEELHSKITYTVTATRSGQAVEVDTRDLVVGDVVSIGVGNVVPADLRLIESSDLECDESVVTGESMPRTKSTDPVRGDNDLSDCAYMGTVVEQGSGRGVVVRAGGDTEFGKIAAGLDEQAPTTSFEKGLRSFSRMLATVAFVIAMIVFVVNVFLHRGVLEALLFAMSIAVGITPELMPAIVTVSMAAGSRMLAKHQVLVKRLEAIEDLGNIQVLFTDKTGTLTEGRISFDRSLGPDGAGAETPFELGLLCNEASMAAAGPVGGNELDRALWAATETGQHQQATTDAAGYRRLASLPFDHDRQMASVLVARGGDTPLLVVKGAPEAVLARCTTPPPSAQATLDALFHDGTRVVAVATRERPGATTISREDEASLGLAGFLTFFDRPKADAGAAVSQLHDLHVDVKIITGDNGIVAAKVCHDIGMTVQGVLNGADVAQLDDAALAAAIPATTVFARIDPEQKSRIVKVARSSGVDVGFMGDGVNDAVALHHADVGISVNTGTDVAKDAADIVMLDKDLNVLATGISEGRRVFQNTMKYVLMATSSNFGNMFSASLSSLFLTFLPMLPSQILLNNLLYDTGQLAIPTDNVDPEQLGRPAAWNIAFVRRFMYVFGPLSSIFDFLTFWVMLGLLHAGHAEFRTGWFVESICTQTLIVYVIRTRRVPFWRSRPSLPMALVPTTTALVGVLLTFSSLRHALGFTALPGKFWIALAIMVAAYLLLTDSAKGLFYRWASQASVPAAPPAAGSDSGAPSGGDGVSAHRIERRAARFTGYPSAGDDHADGAGTGRAAA